MELSRIRIDPMSVLHNHSQSYPLENLQRLIKSPCTAFIPVTTQTLPNGIFMSIDNIVISVQSIPGHSPYGTNNTYSS